MSDVFAIRDLDQKTKEVIYEYAQKHEVKVADAVRDLVFYGMQHLKHAKKEKKYESIFEVYEKLKFQGEPNLSQKIDEVVYE